jgi:hypothetical protein
MSVRTGQTRRLLETVRNRRHIAQIDGSAVRVALDDDVLGLFGVLVLAGHADGVIDQSILECCPPAA